MSIPRPPRNPLAAEKRASWRKNRRLTKSGFKDLQYLPRSRAGFNATLAAHAFSVRRRIAGTADLNLWATMHGCPASARYEELGRQALVLWHGTSAERAAKIKEVGLFHKRGLWTTLEPGIAHGYTRSRSRQYGAGSAAVVLLLDNRQIKPGVDYSPDTPEVFRFHSGLPPESIAYILWDDHIEFLGRQKAKRPRQWGVAHFKKKDGRWVPRSRPPVRFDDQHTYGTLEQWLQLSVVRILGALGSAAAIEVFSSLYMTVDPWDALEHEIIFSALERLCGEPRQRRGFKQFRLRDVYDEFQQQDPRGSVPGIP